MFLEIIGVVLTFAFSPKLLKGTFLRNTNTKTNKEIIQENFVKIGFVLILIGFILQMYQAIYSYIN